MSVRASGGRREVGQLCRRGAMSIPPQRRAGGSRAAPARRTGGCHAGAHMVQRSHGAAAAAAAAASRGAHRCGGGDGTAARARSDPARARSNPCTHRTTSTCGVPVARGNPRGTQKHKPRVRYARHTARTASARSRRNEPRARTLQQQRGTAVKYKYKYKHKIYLSHRSNPQQAASAVGASNKSRSGALEARHCASNCLE